MAKTKATVRRTGRLIFIPPPRQRIGSKKNTEQKAKEHIFQNKKNFCHKKSTSKLKKWPSRKKNEREAKIYLLYRKT